MRLAELASARIGLLGYGREGRAAITALRAAYPAIDLTVLAESGALPADLPARLGPFDDRLQDFDILLRSPGVPVLHPALQRYQASGGRMINPASIWFAERPQLPVIGVTGSKGKSTTASLLAHLLSAGGRRVLLAGNIGVPLLDHLNTDAELVVLESSSYQLADLAGRFSMGLITRLFPEHGDWHGGVEHYYASKLRIVDLLQGGPLLINARDPVLCRHTAAVANRILVNQAPCIERRDDGLVCADRRLTDLSQVHLMGRHNLDNAALALEAARRLNVDLDLAVAALKTFRPLAHRLERVAERAGLRWINDSIATTPHATLAALEALQGEPVVLIAGGYVRPADWSPVLDHCLRHPLKGLVLMPDSGSSIAADFERAGLGPIITRVDSLANAVIAAAQVGGAGASILLSPGAASFPQFRDFEDRGSQFRAAVARYYSERSTA
ncbi:MAG: UDP-N-acetylmuramoyl-L-alanine--D-glutamate ligase [Wenzhouxiangella sp.]